MKPDVTRIIDVFLEGARRPLIVILGPTASGKTSFSIELARNINGEVVNADSRQLYRFLDIGTAKITQQEMQGVPHHLIGILDPKDEATIGTYQESACAIIDDILVRGKVPLLVGGSMLYISAITDALTLAPAGDPAIRKRLEAAYEADDGEALYKRLQTVDPDAAAGTHRNNKHRIIRSLEIYEMLNMPKSHAISSRGELRPRGSAKDRCVYDLLIFGIDRPPEELKKRMSQRIDQMMDAGWIEEVRDLLARGYRSEDPGMKSHGYSDIVQYLLELERAGSDADIDVMKEALKRKIMTKTRRYAKRQHTWWRGDDRIRWIIL
ncbi:MAG TPA: tRNA (adenosine(37)-N6)-dimethylallyltransferase MiaA [Candidatus Peribacterales bacterium]|nr:tRNA (adenosine(37)-N6)-dimethylallyltransferase MiaA [Candidatus Peribacterales bacterium]